MDELCRFCTVKCTTLENIFAEREQIDNEPPLIDILETTTSCEIMESDSLPQNICGPCISAAKNAFEFKQRCEESQKYFQTLLTECEQKPNFDEIQTGDWCITEIDTGEIHIKTEKEDDTVDDNLTTEEPNEKDESWCITEIDTGEVQTVTGDVDEDNYEGIRDILTTEDSEEADEKKQHVCGNCNKRYSHKSDLLRHLVVHTNERPFKCEHCPKAFKLSYSLVLHQKVHSDDRPFKCELCPRALKTKDGLRKHIISHSDVRPFKCEFCQREFKRDRELKRHIMIHKTVRPHKCEYCPMAFKRNDDLKKHRLVHPDARKKSVERKTVF